MVPEDIGSDPTARKLKREMQVRFGQVPRSLESAAAADEWLALNRHEFLFTTPGGARFHYRRGEGILAELPNPAACDEFEVYLWGTVFGAVAWLNGMFPLHASAVVADGRVLAFTADSGGGKSTLATALAARGFAHLCDDTLALAHAGTDVVGIPDGKPIKLWASALALTGSTAARAITTLPGKFYTSPQHAANSAGPLSDLFLLGDGPSVKIERVQGASVLTELTRALYRPEVPVALGNREGHGEWLLRLAQQVRVWRLERPRTPDYPEEFAATMDAVARVLRTLPPRAA